MKVLYLLAPKPNIPQKKIDVQETNLHKWSITTKEWIYETLL
jgi:hypothetical protein